MAPWKVIQELEADNSRLKKEAIIRRESDADNVRFFEGICMALDGFRTFGVQKVPVSKNCLLYTSPSPRDGLLSRMPSSA